MHTLMEAPPSLKLVMLQGPREGETLEFQPGTAIRIGRVARGNTLPIKDAGISSKHLSILTESGKWVLRDLDSSNGTVFNGSKIPPHTPFHLHDGATVKIGEFTSIHVTLLQPSGPPRRNPRRRGRTGSEDVGFVPVEPGPKDEGGSDAPPVEPEPVAKQGRARPTKGNGLKGKVQIHSIDENGGNESGYVGQPSNTRVTRNSKYKQSGVAVSESRVGNLGAVEEKVDDPKNTRVTRNSKDKQSAIAVNESSDGDLDAPKEKVEDPKNARLTRNLKNKQRVIGDSPQNSNLECKVEKIEAKKTRGGARRRKLQEECAKVAELEEAKVVEDGDLCSVKETCDGRQGENCDAQKKGLNGDGNGSGNWPYLEKLSLGEWFDFLEVHLPKQIIDATEEMIDSMRQKAERLREYIIKQKDDKGKIMPVE